ncbi:hypothetical protein L0222_32625 [bacterium]|nr:hypothetical protein [bacterium]
MKILVAVVLLAFSLAGCTVHHHGPRPYGKVVVVERAHIHTAHCGHYRHGTTWYFAKGHVHGPRCGHVFVSGFWILR